MTDAIHAASRGALLAVARPRPIRIDVTALRDGPGVGPLRDLVTRPTGRAVRRAIEGRVASVARFPSVSVVDFTGVRVLDFSCADEVMAKLLLRYLPENRPADAFFLFRAREPTHGRCAREALARHGIAAVCDVGRRRCRLVGQASAAERSAWDALERLGRVDPGERLPGLDNGADPVVGRLARRRLIYRGADGGLASLSALAGAPNPNAARNGGRRGG